MTDREKVVSHLQIIRTWADVDQKYGGIKPECCDHIVKWIDDALELLKEQEPKHTQWVHEPDRTNHWHCSGCGHVIGVADLMDNYCPNCGAKMQKWTHIRLMAELGAPTYENY